MERGQLEKRITIHVIDDNQWEPDETFFVKLSLVEGEESHAKLGSKTIALVTIINDDGKLEKIEDKYIYLFF
jgi:solute carrier family 8 (sodium/calcium exchanger)